MFRGREMREGRALINWTFRGYSTGQVTATPVWLSNSVFTWLVQLARILCGASQPPLFRERAGGMVDHQTFSPFFIQASLLTRVSGWRKNCSMG